MLERAAGCLENAGRRFFRDSNGAIRHSRSLYPLIGHNNGASADFPSWLLALVQISDLRGSHSLGATSNTRAPFLDFLYPPQTETFAASCLFNASKRIGSRRRRKTVPGLSRAYVSKSASRYQSAQAGQGVLEEHEKPGGEDERERARDSLRVLFNQRRQGDYEEAWTLYAVAGRPLDLKSSLLDYLSRSERPLDRNRLKQIFDEIPVEHRSAHDYLRLAESCVAAGTFPDLKGLCQEAVSSGLGNPCLAFTIAASVNNAQWDIAHEMWNLRPKSFEDERSPDNEWLCSVISQVDLSLFLKNAVGLADFLKGQGDVRPARELVGILIDHAFSSLRAIENTSSKNILLLLRRYKGLGIVTAEHFYKLIQTSQSSDLRTTFIRSIVIYRTFRWQLPDKVPPAKIIRAMMRTLVSFNITNGMTYFMEEFSHFHGKPTPDVYKNALVAFSRAGDVAKVREVFDKLVSDHGPPRSRRLLTPLLYVQARIGNVRETRREFNRIPEEYGLPLNTVCWNNLLTAHANAGDPSGAFQTFDEMLRSGVELNSHTFGILMGVCANKGDIDNVRRLLAMAKERQMQITAPMIDPIVEAYCRNGKFDVAESVAETCLGLEVQGSRVRMWNILLWHYAFRLDLEAVSRIRSRMDKAGLLPDGMTYAALMLSLALIGKTDSARRIFRSLHRNKRVHATEFHYTIILYGYVRERNRDMVHIVFREIKERFQRPGSSSSLLFLKNQLQRDLQSVRSGEKPEESASVRLENAEKFLAETIADFDTTKLATKEPMPATGRQSAMEAFPSMFYEYVMNSYGTKGASRKVRELFDQFISRQQTLRASDNVEELAPLRLLNTLMLAHLRADEYKEVEKCWRLAFPRAIKLATPLNVDEWLSAHLPPADSLEPPRPSLPQSPQGAHDLLVDSDASDLSEELISQKNRILPSYKFMLSKPLSLYLRSLAYRNEVERIPEVVAEVERAGFSLSSYNWSSYVQLLATSANPSRQIEAFVVFEEKFMPNFPGWNFIRRGLSIKPSGVPRAIARLEEHRYGGRRDHLFKEGRIYWSKIQPDFMYPTYISMVYLASALLDFRERSVVEGGVQLQSLYTEAPKTLEALGSMPYLREKFQGVLLRSRQQKPDKRKIPLQWEPWVWTGGVLDVGGRPRSSALVLSNEAAARTSTAGGLDQHVTDTKAKAKASVSEEDEPEDFPPPKTFDPEDEHDIETETSYEETSGLVDPDDESRYLREPDNLYVFRLPIVKDEPESKELDKPAEESAEEPADGPADDASEYDAAEDAENAEANNEEQGLEHTEEKESDGRS
ncbi:hypothetical protein SI65_01504 [Aspergillus cristatus]|uniref:Pentacotripeptide-repeat region of PRORP domain-containing protein n=1 Tax=Aspergillus cristatus TaxID=573508 RepID=A0A1E3BSG9_ASPCR|nr:hypothetical protein SI65_01504 [Aspergillus cristatus]